MLYRSGTRNSSVSQLQDGKVEEAEILFASYVSNRITHHTYTLAKVQV